MIKACTVLAAALAAVQALPGPGVETKRRGRNGYATGKNHTSVNYKYNNVTIDRSVDIEIDHDNRVLGGNAVDSKSSHGVKVGYKSCSSKASDSPAGAPSPVSADGSDKFAFKSQQKPAYNHNGPIVKLTPNVHWSVNTKVVANVVPLPAKEPSQVYYGVNDKDVAQPRDRSQAGHFAVINYTFTAPSVNLEHSAYVSATYMGASSSLSVSFSDDEAFQHARASWKAEQGLILIANAEGCSQADRCYFKVASVEIQEKTRVIVAQGKASHPDELIEKGETEWGYWSPDKRSDKAGDKGEPKKRGEDFEWGTATSTRPGGMSRRTVMPTPGPGRNGSAPEPGVQSANVSAPRHCIAPPDTKYGLRTACLDEYFDETLDDAQGYGQMSGTDHELLRSVAPVLMEDMRQHWGTSMARRGVVVKRWNSFKNVIKPIYNKAYKAVQDLLTIRGSINEEISFQIPDLNATYEENNKMENDEAMQVESPWGDSILLKSFGQQMPDDEDMLNGYLNIFCVECGVKGSAMIAGRATWTPSGGFLEGQVELRTDIKFALKIGIDAQIVYRHDFKTNLVSVGLPGLSYGVVSIGPYMTVDTRVSFEAAAKGRLLAGAEMGLKDARVLIDIVDAAKSERSGWEPYFQPVLEAEGELMLAAELGLPIGIKCGLKIASWDKSVGLIDEPSIRGIAQVAASIGRMDKNRFSAGFHEEDGCTGISAQMSWRNRLWVDVFDSKQLNLLDTKDRPVARGCISLSGRNVRRELPGWQQTNLSGHVVDLTRTLRGSAPSTGSESHMLSYEPVTIPDMAYNTSRGVAYELLISSAGDTMVVACSDGNVYAVMANGQKHPACSNLWGLQDGVVVHDGNQKIMYVFDDSLDKHGVSRLRVRDGSSKPNMARVVVAPEWKAPPGEGQDMIVLLDGDANVYYPVACDFEDPQKNPSRVFVAKDPDMTSVLEDPDLMHTVTGGKVRQCHPLVVAQDMHQNAPQYITGMSNETTKSGMHPLMLAAGFQMAGSMQMS